MAKNKLAKRRSRKRKARANPDGTVELAYNVGAGFAGYAATRFASRMVYSQAAKKFPGAAEHAQVIASAVSAAGVYLGSKYWPKAEDYHEAASIGAGIALLQAAIQVYLPKFGWIVSDASPDQYADKKKSTGPKASEFATPDVSAFDLDQLLAENDEIEAVPIGRSEADQRALPESSDDSDETVFDEGLGNAKGFGDTSDIENYNGLYN